jgi:hypothetical protein
LQRLTGLGRGIIQRVWNGDTNLSPVTINSRTKSLDIYINLGYTF